MRALSQRLIEILGNGRPPALEIAAKIAAKTAAIADRLLKSSRYVREPNFSTIHPHDLAFLFEEYDRAFFGGECRSALEDRHLEFRLAPRMTRAGGKTSKLRTRDGKISFEIAIAVSMLFDGFGAGDREVTVCGLPCASRLEALQRIFEHEIVHLTELLCWDHSDCAGLRFQGIASRFFGHEAHTHNLITRRERATISGIRVGSIVAFEFEQQHLTGRVNRVTKRATVLVEDPEGIPYSDGRRYRTYYVPLGQLRVVDAAGV